MSAAEHIKTQGAALCAAINGGDAAAAAACYTANPALLPPGAPLQSGAAAVEAYWGAAIGMGLGDVALTSTEVAEFGDVATELGVLTATLDGAPLTGKYIVLWRREGDVWKLDRDIWNFDA